MMHNTCTSLFRSLFVAEGSGLKSLTNLGEILFVIGRLRGGDHSGRLADFLYEPIGNDVGDLRE